jgi:hypothetical protein
MTEIELTIHDPCRPEIACPLYAQCHTVGDLIRHIREHLRISDWHTVRIATNDGVLDPHTRIHSESLTSHIFIHIVERDNLKKYKTKL